VKIWFGVARITADGVVLTGVTENRPRADEGARVLVMGTSGPCGWIECAPDELDEAALGVRALSMRPPAPSPLEGNGRLSVVICTRDRPDVLARCLDRFLLPQSYDAEVVVVDNAPRTTGTRSVVQEFRARGLRVRRVAEPTPGLSRARNLGLREADGDFVAFTDDDVLVDPGWSAALRRGFARTADVGIVTGLVPPAEITTAAQAQFDRKMKWSRNLAPHVYSMRDREQYSWPFPYSAGNFGTGANFAVRRMLALELGGFNECLGAGTRTAGSEDLEMFVRMLLAGHDLAYEPSAVAWHLHRTDEEALRKLMFGYGKGLTALFLANLHRGTRADVFNQSVRAARNLARDRRRELEEGMPAAYLAAEVAGVIYGPVAYGLEKWKGPRRRSPVAPA